MCAPCSLEQNSAVSARTAGAPRASKPVAPRVPFGAKRHEHRDPCARQCDRALTEASGHTLLQGFAPLGAPLSAISVVRFVDGPLWLRHGTIKDDRRRCNAV